KRTGRDRIKEGGFLVLIPAVALVFFPWVSNPFALKQDFAPLLFSAALLYWLYRGGVATVQGFAPSLSARAVILFAASAAASTLGNPQFVAAWLVFSIPLYPALALRQPSTRARLRTALGALAAVTCLLMTRSASGLLALAAVALFGLLFRRPAASVRWVLAGVSLLLLVVAAYLGWSTHTGRGRIMIWVETLLIWMRHPWLGVGLGQYNLHQLEAQHRFFALGDWTRNFHQNAAFVLDAHNQFLQILAEQGLLGFSVFLFLVSLIIRGARRRMGHDPLYRGLAVAWFGQLVLFLWNAP